MVAMPMRALLVTLLSVCAGAHGSHGPGAPALAEVVGELRKSFPGSFKVEKAVSPTVQYCPDNTCEAFSTTKGASAEELTDFAFLFLYYFSDYYELEPWRSREEPKMLAARILAKRRSKACAPGGGKESARCVLREMARKKGVRVEFVRYDEGARHVVPKALP